MEKSPNQRRDTVFNSVIYWISLSILTITYPVSIFLWLPKGTLVGWVIVFMICLLTTTLAWFGYHKLILPFITSQVVSLSKVWKVVLYGGYLLAGIWLSFNIPIISPPADLNPYLPSLVIKLIYRLSTGIVAGSILLFITIWMTNIFPSKKETQVKKLSLFRNSIKYVIPIALVWIIYLLAFFPGMMSADSMDQWGQVLSSHFVDHHPAFHTFLLWLLVHIYPSPAVIAIAQIIALAIVAGLWFAFFERLGISRWAIWPIALIFATVPINGTMVNTLWKDIPYGIAVLGLTLIVATIVVTNGRWIQSLPAQIVLGVTIALVMLIRHDGLVLALGTIVLLILAYTSKWKSWLVACLICAFLYFGIRGPIYNWVGVEKSTISQEGSLSLYKGMMYARQGSETDQLISSIGLNTFKWNCDIWKTMEPGTFKADLNTSISYSQVATNFIRRIPNMALYYARCARSLDWIIWDPYGEVRNTSHVEVLVDPNPYGIKADSKIPLLREWIAQWVYQTSHDTGLNWFIWRPAIFMYLSLFISMVLILRNRDLRFGLVSIPILIQSITFTLILTEPNYRYHYAVFLVALISIPMLFAPILVERGDITEATINKLP